MTITEKKELIRKRMLGLRADLELSYKSKYDQWVCSQLVLVVTEKAFKTVHIYIPIGSEINLLPFIQYLLNEGINVIVPKTLPDHNLQHLELDSIDNLEKGLFGTSHPSLGIEYISEYDLIIVPGLACDSENNRLGYGGGYYDNFMKQHPKAYKIGAFYPFQLLNKVPTETHDVKLDRIIVNSELLDPSQ